MRARASALFAPACNVSLCSYALDSSVFQRRQTLTSLRSSESPTQETILCFSSCLSAISMGKKPPLLCFFFAFYHKDDIMCISEVTDISAAVAAWHWSGHEDITHVQGQRSPRKMVVTGAVAAQCWSDSLEILHAPDQISPVRWWRLSDFEELPHIQGQRSSPSIRIRGVNSGLESNV